MHIFVLLQQSQPSLGEISTLWGFYKQDLAFGAVSPKGWEGPQSEEPGGKTESKRVSSVRNKKFPSTQREGSNAGS